MEIPTDDSVTIHASAFLAHTSNLSTSFLSQFNSTPWVIDSGASDHMTSISSLFNTYSLCSGNKKGENENKDEFENLLETNLPVLETNNSVLPNLFFPNSYPNSSHKETVFEKETSVNEQQLGIDMVPDLTDSSSGGETLLGEDPNQDNYPTTELLVILDGSLILIENNLIWYKTS
ncbi:hypothetical protein QYF36_004787 [Acer negundo]|nr:hypothetical protein QYF36_004787 [Acer negundo]